MKWGFNPATRSIFSLELSQDQIKVIFDREISTFSDKNDHIALSIHDLGGILGNHMIPALKPYGQIKQIV